MKQQVIMIHGWIPKENYKNSLEAIKAEWYDPYKEPSLRWTKTLAEDLWDDYEVQRPDMPFKYFTDYNQWKTKFELVIPYIRDDAIIIGHSLGANFLMKYLDENEFPVNPKRLFIVAPGIKDDENEILGSFNYDLNLSNFKKYAPITSLYQSKDDPVCVYDFLELIREPLKDVTWRIFEDRGHFLSEKLPEIIDEIKSL